MGYRFKAVIYKVGINPCVDVPDRITAKLIATKGYIPVKGEINSFAFQQTLCPVKNGPHRLYVNAPMMKGANVEVGDTASFQIEQDDHPKTEITMPEFLKKELKKEKLLDVFLKQTPTRQKEVMKYMSFLKSDEARQRNLQKLIGKLREGKTMWER